MATTASPSNMTTPKLNFPGPVGTKRRRMRSGGGVSTLTNNNPKTIEDIEDEEKQAQTSKCKGATTIPIFLKSKFRVNLKFLLYILELDEFMHASTMSFASCALDLSSHGVVSSNLSTNECPKL